MAGKDVDKEKDFWGGLKIEISDDQTVYEKTLTGYDKIKWYFDGEVNFWQPLASKTKSKSLNQMVGWLIKFHSLIINLKNNNVNSESGKEKANAEFKALKRQIDMPGNIANSQHYLHSKTEESQLIKSLVDYSPDAVDGAFKFYANDPLPNTNSEIYVGYMQAVALEAGKKHIGDPANNQRASFEIVRNEIEAYKAELEGWHERSIVSVDKQFGDADKKIAELENTYSEKLKLEEPAKFWSTRSSMYRRRGFLWLVGLAGTIIYSVGVFTNILLQKEVPLIGRLISEDKTISIESLKGILLLVATISFTAYLVRLLGKLMLSAFHLERDAEEREQLTVVYLALKKDANVEEEDRKIILQSLFSRADTGLLGADHGPTMPFATLIDKTKGSG